MIRGPDARIPGGSNFIAGHLADPPRRSETRMLASSGRGLKNRDLLCSDKLGAHFFISVSSTEDDVLIHCTEKHPRPRKCSLSEYFGPETKTHVIGLRQLGDNLETTVVAFREMNAHSTPDILVSLLTAARWTGSAKQAAGC